MPPNKSEPDMTAINTARLDDGEKRMEVLSDAIDDLRSSLWRISAVFFTLAGFWGTFMYWTVARIEDSTDHAAKGVHELQIVSAQMQQDLKYHERFFNELDRLDAEIDRLKEKVK